MAEDERGVGHGLDDRGRDRRVGGDDVAAIVDQDRRFA
jgi:hypothetical protein